MDIEASQLGTLDLDGQWVPYLDLYDLDFIPTRLKVVKDEYDFAASFLINGHGATMPQRIRELRGAGKKPIVVERGDRYYVFVSPP